jgi:hypothetical protein
VAGVLGLIAGAGALPREVVRTAAGRGRRVRAIAFHGITDPFLEQEADVRWHHPGEIGAALASFRDGGVCEAVMVGKVSKEALYDRPEALRPDAEALRLLARLSDRRDDSVLGALADWLEEQGIRLLPQHEWLGDLMAEEGALGRRRPDDAQRADVAFGLPLAKAVAGLDIGQTVVVKDGAVLAVEAIEGTDAAIRRAGAIASGTCVVKVAKPAQDPRFDVPTVGPDTLAAMRDAGATCLAVEAGRTLVVDRTILVEEADVCGIVLLGVRVPGGPAPADAAEDG